MALSAEKKRTYRALGHALTPVVMIAAKGLNEGVINETCRALADHELIKVKVAVHDKKARYLLVETLCERTGSELVQNIGKVALIFKKAKEPNPKLSNLVRL